MILQEGQQPNDTSGFYLPGYSKHKISCSTYVETWEGNIAVERPALGEYSVDLGEQKDGLDRLR